MINKSALLFFALFYSYSSFACLHTYQFKVFPIGVANDTIITIDVQIRRTSQAEGKRKLKLDIDEGNAASKMWILAAYVSKYDKNQKLLHKVFIGERCSLGEHYLDSLQAVYLSGYKTISNDYPHLIKFTSSYLSFCDFQHSCELIEVSHVANENYLQYNNNTYPLKVTQDTTYYGFRKSADLMQNILALHVNSVRLYRAGDVDLLITHLATGHELSMGWITDDETYFKQRTKQGEPMTLSKEYKPTFIFDDIEKAVYEEPLLHHGFGVDVFVLVR